MYATEGAVILHCCASIQVLVFPMQCSSAVGEFLPSRLELRPENGQSQLFGILTSDARIYSTEVNFISCSLAMIYF